jgi:site-specific DNA-methyltransferase (adenine-specific)
LPVLERIVMACSNRGDLVLAPFCGTGTALVAAKRHGRRYLGVEVSEVTADLPGANARPAGRLSPVVAK